MVGQPVGIAWADLERQGEEEALGRNALALHALEHLFKKDALVGGMLVDQHEAARVFHEDVELAEDAEDPKFLGRVDWGWWIAWRYAAAQARRADFCRGRRRGEREGRRSGNLGRW